MTLPLAAAARSARAPLRGRAVPVELAPPPFAERVVGALVADRLLREAVLGDLAEGFAEQCAQHGPGPARGWYRGQAARSALPLLGATAWPASGRRARRVGVLLATGVGGWIVLQLLVLGTQLVAAVVLATAGLSSGTWPRIAVTLVAGAGGGLLAGAAAARSARAAPLVGALAVALAAGAAAAAGMLANGGVGPIWYWGGLQLLVLPIASSAGGLLRVALTAGPPGAP